VQSVALALLGEVAQEVHTVAEVQFKQG